MEGIARTTLRPLKDVYEDSRDELFEYREVEQVRDTIAEYKHVHQKLVFTDMIIDFTKRNIAPKFRKLIVDEAQDLTPLQWEQVKLLKSSAERVWYAGDDDQAVHRWMGVRPEQSLEICDDVEILEQSYRVPRLVHALANRIVKRIDVRLHKEWSPTGREGTINYHYHWYDVDIDQGSWTIMARTNKVLSSIAAELRDNGYLFER